MSKKRKDPAFLLYSKDWIVGTAGMDRHVKGVYIDLLAFQHQRGGLPNTPDGLAKLLGMSVVDFMQAWDEGELSTKFVEKDGKFYNEFLNDVVSERSAKGLTNAIIGAWSRVITNANLSDEDREYCKKQFKVSIFVNESSETLTIAITNWLAKCLTARQASLGDANANTVLNTIKDSAENFLEPESPKKFLEDNAGTTLEQLGMKSNLGDGFEFALTQWSLRCIQDGYKFNPNDKAEDVRRLSAGLEKWLNSWLKNEENRKAAKNYKPEQPKLTFKRIIPQQ